MPAASPASNAPSAEQDERERQCQEGEAERQAGGARDQLRPRPLRMPAQERAAQRPRHDPGEEQERAHDRGGRPRVAVALEQRHGPVRRHHRDAEAARVDHSEPDEPPVGDEPGRRPRVARVAGRGQEDGGS